MGGWGDFVSSELEDAPALFFVHEFHPGAVTLPQGGGGGGWCVCVWRDFMHDFHPGATTLAQVGDQCCI